ncbi:hypothetical protein MSG28_006075 [Choristoneura fumiferana]|uniref:Uncharacterized protein n=1 Tax=Choristoneura fumiferana TaxID=7141 RepID=A0ACC0JDL0_CHOFU|nr:hypothetical protein MSG28_006075 [Choristoneura fumiferana]
MNDNTRHLHPPVSRNSHGVVSPPGGRPANASSSGVEKDLRALHAQNWEEIAENRAYWRQLVLEAKIHLGSLSQPRCQVRGKECCVSRGHRLARGEQAAVDLRGRAVHVMLLIA